MFRLIRVARRIGVADAVADLTTLLEATELTVHLNMAVAGLTLETTRLPGGGNRGLTV
jgi:hypothetical protein